LKIADVQQCAK